MAIQLSFSDPFIEEAMVFAVVDTTVVSAADRKVPNHNDAIIMYRFAGLTTSWNGPLLGTIFAFSTSRGSLNV